MFGSTENDSIMVLGALKTAQRDELCQDQAYGTPTKYQGLTSGKTIECKFLGELKRLNSGTGKGQYGMHVRLSVNLEAPAGKYLGSIGKDLMSSAGTLNPC